MGEAKRRLRSNKGVPLIGQGLLFPSGSRRVSPAGFAYDPPPASKLNSAILYWDKIAAPTNNLFHFELPGEDTLIKEGLLIRPMTIGQGIIAATNIHDFFENGRLEQYRALNKQTPGFWAFADGSLESIASSSEFETGRTALVNLTQVLPLPPDDVSIDDLLEFKAKRSAELKNLQLHLQQLYLKISDSSDPDLSINHQIKEIDTACENAIRVSKEWWKSIQLSDVKSTLPLVTLGGALAGLTVSMPGTSAILGAAGGLIKIGAGIRRKIKSNRKLPFWYASEVSRNWS